MDFVWRRLASGLIDLVLAVFVCGFAAAALYAATDGRIRQSTFSPANACHPLRSISPAVSAAAEAAAPGYAPVTATECVQTFLGLETNRVLVVAMKGPDTRLVFVPIDAAQQVAQPLQSAWLWPAVFVMAMALSLALTGATPGYFATGLRAEVPARPGLAFVRHFVRCAVGFSWAVVLLAAAAAPGSAILAAALGALVLGGLLIGRPTPLYDRWTGVRVRRA